MRRQFVILLVGMLILTIHANSKHVHHHKRKSNIAKDAVAANPRSFSFEDVPSTNKNDDSNRRTVYELESEFSMDKKSKALKAFQDAISTVLNPPTDDSAMENVKESLMETLQVYQKSGGDLFKQVAEKMKVKPDDFYKSIDDQNKEKIADIVSKKTLTKAEWIELRDMKYKFLPTQKSHLNSGYIKDYYPDIVTYCMVFVAATIDLQFEGEVYKCELSKELDLYRNDVETAIQALIYKRLYMLDPESSDWKWIDASLFSGKDKINYKDRLSGKDLCEGGCVLNDGKGKMPVNEAIMGVASSVLDDASAMLDFLDRILVLLVDKKAFCFDGCICPVEEKDVKMDRGDYVKDYPLSCLGKPIEDKKSCKLLCGTYGESYHWCVTDMSSRRSNEWKKCNPSNKESCVQGWYKK